MLELLLALDIQPVGYADYFALPAAKFDRPSQQIPFLGKRITSNPVNVGTADNPDLETIAQLQPDLILGGVASNKDEDADGQPLEPSTGEGFDVGIKAEILKNRLSAMNLKQLCGELPKPSIDLGKQNKY